MNLERDEILGPRDVTALRVTLEPNAANLPFRELDQRYTDITQSRR
jgi:hypothetical protein